MAERPEYHFLVILYPLQFLSGFSVSCLKVSLNPEWKHPIIRIPFFHIGSIHDLDSVPDILQVLHQIPALPALCMDALDLKGKIPAVVFREKEIHKIVVLHLLFYPVLAEPGAHLTDIHAHWMVKKLFPFYDLGFHLPHKQRAA